MDLKSFESTTIDGGDLSAKIKKMKSGEKVLAYTGDLKDFGVDINNMQRYVDKNTKLISIPSE